MKRRASKSARCQTVDTRVVGFSLCPNTKCAECSATVEPMRVAESMLNETQTINSPCLCPRRLRSRTVFQICLLIFLQWKQTQTAFSNNPHALQAVFGTCDRAVVSCLRSAHARRPHWEPPDMFGTHFRPMETRFHVFWAERGGVLLKPFPKSLLFLPHRPQMVSNMYEHVVKHET